MVVDTVTVELWVVYSLLCKLPQWSRNCSKSSGCGHHTYPFFSSFIAEQSLWCNIVWEQRGRIQCARNTVRLHTLGKKAALFCYVQRHAFEKFCCCHRNLWKCYAMLWVAQHGLHNLLPTSLYQAVATSIFWCTLMSSPLGDSK